MAEGTFRLDPVRGKARIDVLDIMRGIAILGILYMNIPFMGANVSEWMPDMRRFSWSEADQFSVAFIGIFWAGTQRGLFEFLFGAGVMVLTARAMKPDGPVAVADLYYRRNLWLIVFGLIDIFVIAWVGDILLSYGLAALILFPFRKASPKALAALGMAYALFVAVIGAPMSGAGYAGYLERADMIRTMPQLEARKAAGETLSKEETEKLDKWAETKNALDITRPLGEEAQAQVRHEREAREGGPVQFVTYSWGVWNKIFGPGGFMLLGLFEAVCAMFIGMALWKWGVIQGQRTMRFYAALALVAYAFGCGMRAWAAVQSFRFTVEPQIIWIFGEFARLSVTLGHVALFNLLAKTKVGYLLLSPFKAAGRMAFTIYVGTSIVTLWFIFAPWGLGLWDKFGWAELTGLATVINVGMLILANIWQRYFVSGPLEWVWRSLAYWTRQPFVRRSGEPVPSTIPGASPDPLPTA